MFCVPELVFGGSEGVKSNFQILRSRIGFQRYRVRRVPFSCFALPGTFSAVPRALGPVFMFCAPRLIFIGTEVLESCIHVFHSHTSFRHNQGRRVQLSCFPLSDSFSTVPWRRVQFSCFALPD
jgi:hypothetical protein